MKDKILGLLILIVGVSAGIAGTQYYLKSLPQPNQETPVIAIANKGFGWKYPIVRLPTTGPGEIVYSDIRDPGGIPQGLPVRLKIPAIGVNSAIEDALITPDGRMDVPAGSRNVAWFALGPQPGQVGSAVIGGHFGINDGVKFVFYDLDKLKEGDKIYIEDDRGDTLAFQVRSIKLFSRDADATTVFTSDDGVAHLNLITCEGVWNRVNDTYPERRVVFTDAIPAEGSVVVNTLAPVRTSVTPVENVAQDTSAFPRLLGIGAQGIDVAMLQTALEQKGFLTMPLGVTKGFFGALTSAAIARYQTGAGLPPVGVFGPLTRARLVSELNSAPVLPNAGTDSAAPAPVPAEEIATEWRLKNKPIPLSPFTPPPGQSTSETSSHPIITVLLLIAIVFVVFKIARQ